jgi:hypothetical protein
MFELKSIRREAIPAALAKAEKYRLLNDPQNAESICRDVLRVDPESQEALVGLLLSLTDQFGRQMHVAVHHAREVLPQLADPYQRLYYEGVICERWAKAQLRQGTPGYVAYDWFQRAMVLYEEAEKIRPRGDDSAILRWNACARIMKRSPEITPKPQDQSIEAGFEDSA